jgi:uncharacterized RDD family membrane protein YckC
MSDQSTEWHYAIGNQQHGPVPFQTLWSMATSGQLTSDNLVWREGMADWIPATQVPELAGAFGATAAAGGGGGGDEYDLAPPQPGAAPAGAWPSQSHGYAAQQPGPYTQPYAGAAGAGAVLPYGTYTQTGPQQTWWYGGFWLRVVATIIDGVILWIPNTVIQLIGQMIVPQVAGGFGTPTPGPRGTPGAPNMPPPAFWGAIAGIWFAQIVVAWLFEAFFTASKFQGTPGKMALGLRVVDSNGGRLSFGHATGRHFAKMISGIICGIGYIVAAFDERKRALHDIMCTTFVVKKQ